MKKVIIIGHEGPDTDCTVASLIAEDYCRNVLKINAQAKRLGELNNETKFVLRKLGINAPALVKSVPNNESLILIDHNEKQQSINGLDFSRVEMIIDHHKVVMETEKPLSMRAEPWGSSSSVLAKMYQEAGRKISSKIAKMMLAGILSDTLNLTSPTTTDFDKQLVKKLNKVAKLDIKKFVQEMFAAKSSLKGISLDILISQDYKLFEMGKYKTGIGVWETTNPESVNKEKDKIMPLLQKKKNKDKVDYLFFFVVDILKQASFLYVIGEKEKNVAEKVFAGEKKDGLVYLPGIVSRKKQMNPPIIKELTK